MRNHLRAELTSAALLMAAQRQHPAKGLIAHSDRESQYVAGSYRALLEAWGMRQSMGRKGLLLRQCAPWRVSSTRSRSKSSTRAASPAGMRPGASCLPISKATTIAGDSTRLWATARPSKPSGWPPETVSTETRDDHRESCS